MNQSMREIISLFRSVFLYLRWNHLFYWSKSPLWSLHVSGENKSSPSFVLIVWVHRRYIQYFRSLRCCWHFVLQTIFVFVYLSMERAIVGNSIFGQRRGWVIETAMVLHLMCVIEQLLATSLNILHPLVPFVERRHSIGVLKRRSSRTVEKERWERKAHERTGVPEQWA